ncbi:hypothetical protein HNQ59_003779 [Chitinivorax tropicus]|uniref:Uncharacterized protein n=1 Tax=Chitinivorax tropicus TaxID=714531 RepID=A0A840MTP8_9PROT|nr:hypothetical protein [Chitinivorax tropicus]
MGEINHRFTLGMPAWLSALDKRSFSSANWSILAWRAFRSTAGSEWSLLPQKSPVVCLTSCCFHAVICEG